MKVLNLFFPQWQGAGKINDLYWGAHKIKNHFKNQILFTDVPVAVESDFSMENDIYSFREIYKQLETASEIIKKSNPDKLFTLGGDCGVELAPVSYLNKKYSKNIGILWFDAHGDLNTPEESPSKLFHGMPLRTLLGNGEKTLVDSLFSTLNSRQVILIGARDFDQSETDYINKNNITVFSANKIQQDSDSLIRHLQKLGFSNLYIHIDLDVLDPREFPYIKVPAKVGLQKSALLNQLNLMVNSFNIAGCSIVEYKSDNNDGIDYIEQLLTTLKIIK